MLAVAENRRAVCVEEEGLAAATVVARMRMRAFWCWRRRGGRQARRAAGKGAEGLGAAVAERRIRRAFWHWRQRGGVCGEGKEGLVAAAVVARRRMGVCWR